MNGLPGQLQERVAVLADEIFLVIAGDVVPHHPVSVEVVEDGQAGLVMFPLHQELSVVWLGLPGSPRGAPGSGNSALSAAEPHPGAGPEPPVHCRGLEVLAIAALEVAEPARGPDVREVVVLDELLDELVLSGGLEADQVHAVLPADVPAVKPVDLVVREVFFISGEPVVVTAVLKMFGT